VPSARSPPTGVPRSRRCWTPSSTTPSVEDIVGHVRDGIAEVLAEAGGAPGRLLGVGIGVPGIVEHTPQRGARNAVVVLFGSGVGACLVTPRWSTAGRWSGGM
jgi:hypothetical protein